MTTNTDHRTRARLAAAIAAEAIVDVFANGTHWAPEMRMLRSLAIGMLEATLDMDDTPAAELVDEAVRFEIVNRANNNNLMRLRLDRYEAERNPDFSGHTPR